MATTGTGQNKSAFLRDLFRKDPGVNLKGAEKAWTDAGNEGSISNSSFYNVKTALKNESGATGGAEKPKLKPGPKVQKGKKTSGQSRVVSPEVNGLAPTSAPASGALSRTQDRRRVFDEVEDGIDDLIFKLKGLGGVPEVQGILREARRMLGRVEGGSAR